MRLFIRSAGRISKKSIVLRGS
jgi:hypothetical protein